MPCAMRRADICKDIFRIDEKDRTVQRNFILEPIYYRGMRLLKVLHPLFNPGVTSDFKIASRFM